METSTSEEDVSNVTSGYDGSAELPSSTEETNEPWRKILLGVVMFVIVAVTVLGNGLVLLAVAREKRLRTTFNMFVVNLAFTDFLVGLIAMSFYAAFNIYESWPFGEFLCGLWIFTDFGMTLASIMTLLAISMDRYWSVHWSNHYRTHNTPRKAKITIAAIWAITVVVWVPAFAVDRVFNSKAGECIYDPALNKEFVAVVAAVGYHASTAVMLFCYIKVFLFMRHRSKVGLLNSKAHNKRDVAVIDASVKDTKHDISDSDISSRAKQGPTQVPTAEKLSKQHLAPSGRHISQAAKTFFEEDTSSRKAGTTTSVFRTESSGSGVHLRPEDARWTSGNMAESRRPDPDLDSGIESVGGGGGTRDEGNSAARNSTGEIDKGFLQVAGNVSDARVEISNQGCLRRGKTGSFSLGTDDGGAESRDDLDEPRRCRDRFQPPGDEDCLAKSRDVPKGRPTIKVQSHTDDIETQQDDDNQAPSSGLSRGAQKSTAHPTYPAHGSNNALARERKLFLTLTYIIVAFLICWMPFHVSFDIMAVDPNLVPNSFYSVTYWLAYINSAVNPFLYHSSSPEFRRAFSKLFGR